MEPYKSRLKVVIFALLDAILTVAFHTHLTITTVIPLWRKYSDVVTANQSNSTKPEDQEHKRVLSVIESIFGRDPVSGEYPGEIHIWEDDTISIVWLFLYTGFMIIFGAVSILSAGVLLFSTNKQIDPDFAIRLTWLWIFGNIFTSCLAFIQFGCAYILVRYGIWGGILFTNYVYFACQSMLTLVIFDQSNYRAPKSALFDEAMLEAQARLQQIRSPLSERRIHYPALLPSQDIPIPSCDCSTPDLSV